MGICQDSRRLIIIKDVKLDFFKTRIRRFTRARVRLKSSGCTYLASRLSLEVPEKFKLRQRTVGHLKMGAGSLGIQSYYLLVAEGRGLLPFDPFSPDKVFIPRLAKANAIEARANL